MPKCRLFSLSARGCLRDAPGVSALDAHRSQAVWGGFLRDAPAGHPARGSSARGTPACGARPLGTREARQREHADTGGTLCVDVPRGVRRNGTRMASALHQQRDTMRMIAPEAGLHQACLERSAKAPRGVPTMLAPWRASRGLGCSRGVAWTCRRCRPLPCPRLAMPSGSRARVASTRTVT